MDLPRELDELKRWLEAPNEPGVELRRNGEDVKAKEIAIAKNEIEELEKLLLQVRDAHRT